MKDPILYRITITQTIFSLEHALYTAHSGTLKRSPREFCPLSSPPFITTELPRAVSDREGPLGMRAPIASVFLLGSYSGINAVLHPIYIKPTGVRLQFPPLSLKNTPEKHPRRNVAGCSYIPTSKSFLLSSVHRTQGHTKARASPVESNCLLCVCGMSTGKGYEKILKTARTLYVDYVALEIVL